MRRMQTPLDPTKLDAMFGPLWSSPGVFYKYDAALRFELGIGSHSIDRMLSAFLRANTIATDLLGNADDLHLTAVRLADLGGLDAETHHRISCGLRDCGLPPMTEAVTRLRSLPDSHSLKSDRDVLWEMVVPISREQMYRSLWSNVVCDFGIAPSVDLRFSIVSESRGLLLCAYDDRGMDIVGTSVEVLLPVFQKYTDWLLDYDMESMRKVFVS